MKVIASLIRHPFSLAFPKSKSRQQGHNQNATLLLFLCNAAGYGEEDTWLRHGISLDGKNRVVMPQRETNVETDQGHVDGSVTIDSKQ